LGKTRIGPETKLPLCVWPPSKKASGLPNRGAQRVLRPRPKLTLEGSPSPTGVPKVGGDSLRKRKFKSLKSISTCLRLVGDPHLGSWRGQISADSKKGPDTEKPRIRNSDQEISIDMKSQVRLRTRGEEGGETIGKRFKK